MSYDANSNEFSQTEDSQKLAAQRIQDAWKSRKKSIFNADSRWADAAIHAKLQTSRLAAEQGKNDPKSRWRRAAFLASRLQDDDASIKKTVDKSPRGTSKALETQHWLELTDSKHRYGSNLKVTLPAMGRLVQYSDIKLVCFPTYVRRIQYYHKVWLESNTTDNFFRWLDRGDGKDLSLPKCPREKLERERIVYLSAEQRMNYLVEIDDKGLLRWACNHTLVDTSHGKWKDSGNGNGIVPRASDGNTTSEERLVRRTSFFVSPPTSRRASAKTSGIHNHTSTVDESTVQAEGGSSRKCTKRRSLLSRLRTRMLRNLVSRNTWIYVADTHYNIFIGIKDTGVFQHSSFLSGGLVVSAGLISVHEGLIHKLSPLSGHYRTNIEDFREFVQILEEKGVDMHRVEKLRAEASLWGIQQINRAKRFKKNLKQNATAVIRKAMPSTHAKEEKADKQQDKCEYTKQWK